MWKLIGICAVFLAGCATLVPSNPVEARKKLAVDLGLDAAAVVAVRPCTFAITPAYVRRAEFVECALVETEQGFFVARAVKDLAKFEKSVSLQYSEVEGFNLRLWGLGAAQLQFIGRLGVVSVHLKAGGRESIDQPEEAKKVASALRAKGVREVESLGRVDQAVDGAIPFFIPIRK